MTALNASYDRPTAATLIVRLANGEEWEATEADIAKFRLVDPNVVYRRFTDWVNKALDVAGLPELGSTALNPLRYALECALMYPHMPEDGEAAEVAGLAGTALLLHMASEHPAALAPTGTLAELAEAHEREHGRRDSRVDHDREDISVPRAQVRTLLVEALHAQNTQSH